MSATGCLSRDELAAYLAGVLGEARSQECESHLAVCPRCRQLADELESLPDDLIGLMRQPAAAVACLAEPEFQQVLAGGRDLPLVAGTAGREVAPESPQDALPLPRRLGQYELLEVIGHGGMGTVYRARHTMLQRSVAIKVLSGERTESRRAVTRFHREMKAIGALDHPHIVRASDAGEEAGLHYLVMDFVDGWHLAQLTQALGPLPVADACEMARQAALALQSIHEHGLVHRDVKPSNLMLSADGQVKLLDLGLGLLREETPQNGSLTDSGAFMGTCDYMAPEQCEDSHHVTIQSDLYGLGCTLYELLCGHAPFSGPQFDTRGKKIVAHVHAHPTPIRNLRPEVSKELAAVVDRLLAKQSAGRFQTPAELAAALAPLAQTADLPALVRRMRPGIEAFKDTSGKGRSTEDSIRSQVVDTSTLQPSLPASPQPQPSRLGRRWLALATGLAAVLLLAVIVTIQTSKGTVVIEGPDGPLPEDIRVAVLRGGEEIEVVDAKDNWRLKLREGQYDFELLGGSDQFELKDQRLTVKRFGRAVVSITRKDGKSTPTAPAPVPAAAQDVVAASFPAGGTVEEQTAWLVAELKRLNPGFDRSTVGVEVEFRQIATFRATGESLVDLTPLRMLLRLLRVEVRNTGIRDVSALHGLPLRKLDVLGTKIRDLSSFKGLPLEELTCSFTAVSDLTPLIGMPLKCLNADGTQVTDLTPLKGA